MAFFFRPYPTISYRVPGTNRNIPVTDITRRFSVVNFIRNNRVTFDEYTVQDGERPDIIAHGYYDDSTLDWLVLLTNEIHDPYYEWPLSYEQFNLMILQKYRGYGTNNSDLATISYVNQTVHHYEQIIQEKQIITDLGQQRIIEERTLVVDYTTYLTLIASKRRAVSIYEYESKLNDDRRRIYLLDLHYTQLIKEQHPYIFEEGVYTR
jgi:hypothetical protein